MRMSNVSKDSVCHELSFVCFMPEDLPFEIHERTKEKDCAAEQYDREFGGGYFPDTVVCGQRSK